jgi:hypothetical protein
VVVISVGFTLIVMISLQSRSGHLHLIHSRERDFKVIIKNDYVFMIAFFQLFPSGDIGKMMSFQLNVKINWDLVGIPLCRTRVSRR